MTAALAVAPRRELRKLKFDFNLKGVRRSDNYSVTVPVSHCDSDGPKMIRDLHQLEDI